MNIKRYYMKLYNKEHVFIDDLEVFSNLKYTHTLNGMGSMTFNININYLNSKFIQLALGQHIELYKVDNSNEEHLLWYGVINTPSPTKIEVYVTCLGYASLLQNRKFTDIELNSENKWKYTYSNKTYGKLIFDLINRINNIYPTSIELGSNIDTYLKTERVIDWNDDLYDKIQEFIEDSNCYFTVDKDRKFNFYKELGEDKSDYYEIFDYNINDNYDYTIDQSQIINVVHARTMVTHGEGDDEYEEAIIVNTQDNNSINQYGYREAVVDLGSVTEQTTAQNMVDEYLNTYKEPLVSLRLKVGICDTFNIFDINVGDYILLNSETYAINKKIRVMEYTVDLHSNTVDITLGNTIFRDSMPKIYRY